MSTLRTAGDLRTFLADTLIAIKEGTIGPAEANAIAKVSAQINQSLQVEVATRLQMKESGNEPAGGMLLGAPDESEPLKLEASVETAKPSAAPIAAVAGRHSNEKIWCEQCEMRVTAGQAVGCKSPHCKAKLAA